MGLSPARALRAGDVVHVDGTWHLVLTTRYWCGVITATFTSRAPATWDADDIVALADPAADPTPSSAGPARSNLA